jgi:CRISPR-associated exonuclease Cas4
VTHDVLVPISALEHWSYCPRQCALIHLEAAWDENLFTLQGRKAHERADEPMTRTERGVRVERALPVWSEVHGLVGKCDVVEFQTPTIDTRPREGGTDGLNVQIGQPAAPTIDTRPREGGTGLRVVPVEYKLGGAKILRHAAIQLCAQALCLEEMFGIEVPSGAVFLAARRVRREVALGPELRADTLRTLGDVRAMLSGGNTPPAEFGPKCRHCSLERICLPRAFEAGRRAARDAGPFKPRRETELP